MTTTTTALAITQLTLYILLLPALIYLPITHSKHTLPGYLYLLIFAILQLISAGLHLSDPQSPTSSILSSVGLSPVLLGLAGILHAAHTLLSPASQNSEKKKLAWAFQLALHLLTPRGGFDDRS
jgi:protein-S-isoprenylcysteine O-methyltransferase Ste14